jgi:hypothetical protein
LSSSLLEGADFLLSLEASVFSYAAISGWNAEISDSRISAIGFD